jgi:hypothetical protein
MPRWRLLETNYCFFILALQMLVASYINFLLQSWCIEKGGPFIVSLYVPILMIILAMLSILILGDSLHGNVCSLTLSTYNGNRSQTPMGEIVCVCVCVKEKERPHLNLELLIHASWKLFVSSCRWRMSYCMQILIMGGDSYFLYKMWGRGGGESFHIIWILSCSLWPNT